MKQPIEEEQQHPTEQMRLKMMRSSQSLTSRPITEKMTSSTRLALTHEQVAKAYNIRISDAKPAIRLPKHARVRSQTPKHRPTQ